MLIDARTRIGAPRKQKRHDSKEEIETGRDGNRNRGQI
jgi:hypothetical protein